MNKGKLLMISTDRLIFDKKSAVCARQIEYAKEWERVDIVIFTEKKSLLPKELQLSANCFVYGTNSVSKIFFPQDSIILGKKLIKDHALSEITCQDPSFTAMAGIALKNKFKIPLEIQIHGDIGSAYFNRGLINKIRFHLSKKYLPKADKIRVVSNRIKDFVDKLLKDRLKDGIYPIVEVRPIFIDTESIKNSPIVVDLKRKYRQFEQIVLMASRLEKEKNIALAIESWKMVTKIFPRAGLIIVGNGSLEHVLKHLIVKNDLTKSIIFEPWLDKSQLYSYYKTSDIFLNTSFYEGYGMTLIEAKASGCKVISTDVGVAREIGATIIGFNKEDVARKIISAFPKRTFL